MLAAIYPASLSNRLESILKISRYHLQKYFKKFMSQTIKLSEAFHLVDCGPTAKSQNQNKKSRESRKLDMHPGNTDDTHTRKQEKREKYELNKKKLPIRLCAPHKEKGFCHFLKDCTSCPKHEKKDLLHRLVAEKALTGSPKGYAQSDSIARVYSKTGLKGTRVLFKITKKTSVFI